MENIKQRIRVNGLEQILDQIKDGIEVKTAKAVR